MKTASLILFASALLGSTSQATILVQYDMLDEQTISANGPLTEQSAASFTAAGVTSSAFQVWAPAISGNSNGGGVTSSAGGSAYMFASGTAGTALLAVDNMVQFHEFTIQAVSELLDLSDLTFNYFSVSGTLPDAGVALQSSIGGFGSANPIIGTVALPERSDSGAAASNLVTISLTSLASVSGPVTFRLSFYDSSSSNNVSHRVDNVTLSGGLVAIPEPGTASLLLVCAAGIFARMRRRRDGRVCPPLA